MTLSEFLLFALPAIFLTGLSKGGFGGALGGIAVPLLALAISPKQAAAVMLPILCLADVVGLKAYIGHWDKANLKVMMPGASVSTWTILPVWELVTIAVLRSSGISTGLALRYMRAAPTARAVAGLVPLTVVAKPSTSAASTVSPGAQRLTPSGPRVLASWLLLISIAPTQITPDFDPWSEGV